MSNLLEKASILLTPTGYDDGSMNCIKPNTSVGDFDFTRGSSATRVNEQGLIKDVQVLGSELITNGDFATDSNWTKGTGWTISGGTANQDGSNGILRQNSAFSTNTKLKVTFDLTNFGGSGSLTLKFAPNSYPITLNGNGSYTVFTDGTNSVNGDLQIITNNGFVGSIDNVSAKEVIDNTNLPRIDYTDGTGSLLLEPQSTNLLTYSQDFSQSYWNKVQISVDDDFTISPDGTQNASKITTNNNTPFLGNTTISLTTGSVYTISCFVKKGTNRWVRLSSVSSGTLGAWFDLDNNVVGTVNSTSASIENYGNGWYRISNTITAISGSNQTFLGLSDDDGGTTVTGTGHTVFAWGFQVEEQSYPTSYIPTLSGSTVTRNQDVCTDSGSIDLINSTEGVLYAEIAALDDDLTFRGIALSDGTNDNRVLLRYRTNSNQINLFIKANGANIVNSTKALTDITNFSKFALKYKSGDIALWIDGVEAKTNTNTFTLIGLNRLSFDAGNGSDNFYGKVKSVAVFKEALTDEQLTCLTS